MHLKVLISMQLRRKHRGLEKESIETVQWCSFSWEEERRLILRRVGLKS